MNIKNIRSLIKETAKEEWKKKIVQVGVVSLEVLFTLGSIPVSQAYENYKEQRIEKEHSIKNISLSECKVIVENCPDGTVKHHFINKDYNSYSFEENDKYTKRDYKYGSVTDDNFAVSYSKIDYNTKSYFCYNEMPETYGSYIFDYNIPYYLVNVNDLALPNGYSLEDSYSVNDLKELEEELNNSIYKNRNEEESYRIRFLCLVEIDGSFMCFDFSNASEEVTETTDIEDVTKLRNVYYVPSVENNLVNLKISSGENAIADKETNFHRLWILDNYISGNFVVDAITSLNQTIQEEFNGKQIIVKDLNDYLTFEQMDKGELSKEEITTILNKLNYPENKLKRKIANAANELTEQNESIVVSYSAHGNDLTISKKENVFNEQVSDDFYEELNKIIEENNIDRLCLKMDDRFDLEKINTSKIPIKTLYFKNFQGTIDCSSLNGKVEMYFTNTNGKVASDILSNCDTRNTYIYWSEEVENTSELSDFLKGIIYQNKEIHSLDIDIKEKNKGNYNGITQEDFELLSKMNVENLYIDAEGFKQPINLDLELNPKIQCLSIIAYEVYDTENDIYKNSELEKVSIKSENKDFFCRFYHTDITKNTRFSLPNSSSVGLYNLNCLDISAFKDLRNVNYLGFKEDWHADGIVDNKRGEMIYAAEEMPASIFGEIPYTDYNKFLKDLEYFFKLKQLREKMDFAPGYSYYDEKKIGAYATLENDNVCGYKSLEDLSNKQNPISFYFGDKELRCISSICLANNENKINVDNMEEYKYYMGEGYEVIGVTFVNLYSTCPEDYEIFVAEEDVKLKRIPFE